MTGVVLLRNRVRGQSATFQDVLSRAAAGQGEGAVRPAHVLLTLLDTPACGAARGLRTLGPPVDLLADLVRAASAPPAQLPVAPAAGPDREIRLVRGSRRPGAPVPRTVLHLRVDDPLFHSINLAWLYGHRWRSRLLGTPHLLVGMAQQPTTEVYRAVRLWGLDVDDLTARIAEQVRQGALDEG